MAEESQFHRWLNLKRLYRSIFLQGNRERSNIDGLLNDLKEFCYAEKSCVIVGKSGMVDTHASLLAEGRREVYLRIQSILNLSDEAINKMKELEHE